MDNSNITNLTVDALTVNGESLFNDNVTFNVLPTCSLIPSNNYDLVNKEYADAISSGLNPKESVQVATTTSNITLSGTPIVDGYQTILGDRILVKNQTDSGGNTSGTSYLGATANGIYIVSSSTWSRSSDFATGSYQYGSFTLVENGNTNSNKIFLEVESPGLVGTNALLFTYYGNSFGSIGRGLTANNNVISVSPDLYFVNNVGSAVTLLSLGQTGNNTTVNSNLNVIGTTNLNNTNINGTLGVTGTSNFKGNVNINGTLGITGTANFNGISNFNNNVNISNTLGVTGISNFGGTGNFNNNVNINGILGVTGLSLLNNVNINGSLGVTGSTSTFKDIYITNSLGVSGSSSFGGTGYFNNVNIIGILGVTGVSNFGGTANFNNVNINGSLGVTGISNFKNNVNINGVLGITGISNFGGTSNFNNNVNINGILGVTGISNFGGTGNFKNNVNINGGLGVTGISNFGGTGNFKSNVNINGALGVTGIMNANSGISFFPLQTPGIKLQIGNGSIPSSLVSTNGSVSTTLTFTNSFTSIIGCSVNGQSSNFCYCASAYSASTVTITATNISGSSQIISTTVSYIAYGY